MSEDDRSGHGASLHSAKGGGAVDPVVLPEHASAYYSPRPPPAETSHRTMEVVAVKLDASVDPRLADTQRVSIDGLQPPPWLAPESGPRSDAPTVLIPIVRARRFRNRALATTAAALFGASLGAWFGLRSEAPPRPSPTPWSDALARSAAPPPVVPAEPAPAPTAIASTSVAAVSVAPPAPSTPSAAGVQGQRPPSRRGVAGASAWLKPEPPRAWFK